MKGIEDKIYEIDSKQDEINLQYEEVKKALEFVEKARNNIADYIDSETELDEADSWLFNAVINLKSQLRMLNEEEDDLIEEFDNIGSYSEDSQHMSQWEFIDKNNCNKEV